MRSSISCMTARGPLQIHSLSKVSFKTILKITKLSLFPKMHIILYISFKDMWSTWIVGVEKRGWIWIVYLSWLFESSGELNIVAHIFFNCLKSHFIIHSTHYSFNIDVLHSHVHLKMFLKLIKEKYCFWQIYFP